MWAVAVSMVTGVSAATWLLQPPRQLRSSFSSTLWVAQEEEKQ